MSKDPYKFDDLRKETYLQRLREGHGRCQAAASVAISRSTIASYRNDNPAFKLAESQAQIDSIEVVENALFKAATENLNVTAIQVFLYNRAPDRWKDRRNVVHSGKIDLTREEAEAVLNRGVKLMKDRGKLTGPRRGKRHGRNGNGAGQKAV